MTHALSEIELVEAFRPFTKLRYFGPLGSQRQWLCRRLGPKWSRMRWWRNNLGQGLQQALNYVGECLYLLTKQAELLWGDGGHRHWWGHQDQDQASSTHLDHGTKRIGYAFLFSRISRISFASNFYLENSAAVTNSDRHIEPCNKLWELL